ncbi:MAG: hypothetical protein VX768_06955 [Planctomycetota bacterium]|nr:hypothetical protein [Planctomycetota bacterium]
MNPMKFFSAARRTATFPLIGQLLCIACCLTLVPGLTGQENPLQETENPVQETKDRPQRTAESQIKTFEDLCEAYTAQKIKFQKNETNQTLLFPTRSQSFSSLMVIRWDQVNGVVHFIQTMPLTVKKEQVPLYLKAAQQLNHGFLFPGIGINLENGGTYYRLSVPVSPRGYLFDYEVGTYTKFALRKASEFMPTLQSTLDGQVPLEGIIQHHQKHLRTLRANAKQYQLTGRYQRSSQESEWILDFSEPGVLKVLRDGKTGVVSDYTQLDREITLTDREGPLAAKSKGVYEILLSNGKLSWKKKSDPVLNRSNLLTTGSWEKQE